MNRKARKQKHHKNSPFFISFLFFFSFCLLLSKKMFSMSIEIFPFIKHHRIRRKLWRNLINSFLEVSWIENKIIQKIRKFCEMEMKLFTPRNDEENFSTTIPWEQLKQKYFQKCLQRFCFSESVKSFCFLCQDCLNEC